MVAAGKLDRLVVIQRKTVVQDDLGQPVETWATWRTVKMGKQDIKASERFRAQQDIATETTVWLSHWIPSLTAEDRLVNDGVIYEIEGVAEIGRRQGLEITSTAVRNA